MYHCLILAPPSIWATSRHWSGVLFKIYFLGLSLLVLVSVEVAGFSFVREHIWQLHFPVFVYFFWKICI
jgi:hypothetical protein